MNEIDGIVGMNGLSSIGADVDVQQQQQPAASSTLHITYSPPPPSSPSYGQQCP